MQFRSPLGLSDFRQLREENLTYVDKTSWVSEVLQDTTRVLLFPRPRRFGKTLNLSTLRYFVEKSKDDHTALFKDLFIWQQPEARKHFQKYPVIFLSFKDIKMRTWDEFLDAVTALLSKVCEEFRYVIDSPKLTPEARARFLRMLQGVATNAEYEGLLSDLSKYLGEYHESQVVILIDEYDTPIQSGHLEGYYDQVAGFFRNFLSAGFKDNVHLFKGVLTGILRVAKEGLFSGLNNVIAYGLLEPRYSTAFGFTDAEVAVLTEVGDQLEHLDEFRRWYNGYIFGGHVIYNPWSILNYLDRPEQGFRPFWVNTSSNDLLRKLLLDGGLGLKGELETLLTGGSIEKYVDEDIVLRDIESRAGAIWSFLLFSGYLKATEVSWVEHNRKATLSLPNVEVRYAFRQMVEDWVQFHMGTELEVLLRSLLTGQVEYVQDMLTRFLQTSMSYHDVGGKTPEQVYHAFFLGLLVGLRPEYDVKSNRESGYGRVDLMIVPTKSAQPGVILELKTVSAGDTLAQTLEKAMLQLEQKQYRAELQQQHASAIWEWAVAFDGKKVQVQARKVELAGR